MYRRRRSRKISARTLFFGLMGLALLAVWLPAARTRSLNHVLQLLAPAEDALYKLGTSVGESSTSLSEAPVPPEQFEEYRRRNQALANTIASLSARVDELESMNRELTGLRRAGFPQEGRLIPARVIRRDAVAWRDAVLLDRGASSSSRPDDWVISRRFVNVGTDAGAAPGMAVLAGETLLGRVISAAPYTSVVCLLSDPTQSMSVRIGRIEEDRLESLPADFLLKGVGHGRMVIEDVNHHYIDPQRIRVGDLVVSPPGDAGLPVSQAIGHIIEIEPHADSPLLLYRLTVKPLVDTSELQRVYVVDTSPES